MNVLDLREPVSALSHGTWLLLSFPALVLLWRRGGDNLGKRISLAVFGLSLAACYAGSALYHGVQGPPERVELFALVDYIGIYLLIAGSYTPIAWNLMRGRARRLILTVAWASAASGISLQLACRSLPAELRTALYLALGWGALYCYVDIAARLTHRPLRAFLGGGILYSIGAVLNLMHWPVLWPGVFEAHELFHFFVMAGSLSHFAFMLRIVAPACPDELPPRAPLPLPIPVRPAPRDGSDRWARMGAR